MAKNSEKKQVKLSVVALCAFVTVIWIINCVAHIVYNTSEFLIILNAVCAVIWCAAFVIQLLRYRKGKKAVEAE